MTQGAHLRINRRGTDALGVTLEGDRRKPEPGTFLVTFPGGEVEITRTSKGDYWVHLAVGQEGNPGRIVDARLDAAGKHASDMNQGDFDDPALYHVAMRVIRTNGEDPLPDEVQGDLFACMEA